MSSTMPHSYCKCCTHELEHPNETLTLLSRPLGCLPLNSTTEAARRMYRLSEPFDVRPVYLRTQVTEFDTLPEIPTFPSCYKIGDSVLR